MSGLAWFGVAFYTFALVLVGYGAGRFDRRINTDAKVRELEIRLAEVKAAGLTLAEQFLFSGSEGGECDYAIAALVTSLHFEMKDLTPRPGRPRC